ncbi:extracellular solute-binding protein, partial [Bacillus sp. S34]|nr:extracellular solute-binding protein [Bacillus sp. S34]
NVDGIKRYLDLMQSDKVVNPSNAQYDNGTQAVSDFANGKAAMMINGPWQIPALKDSGIDYGIAQIPVQSASDTAREAIPTYTEATSSSNDAKIP